MSTPVTPTGDNDTVAADDNDTVSADDNDTVTDAAAVSDIVAAPTGGAIESQPGDTVAAADTAAAAAAPAPANVGGRQEPITSLAPPSPAPSSASTAAPSAPVGQAPATPDAPRTRWGGIIWGFVFLALAGVGFWGTAVLDPGRLADLWLSITPLAIGAGMVLLVGAIAVLCALVALARHLQRRSAAHRSRL